MKKRDVRRTLATLLALALCIGLLPGTVLAENEETPEEEEIVMLSADDVGETDAEAEEEVTQEVTEEATEEEPAADAEDPESENADPANDIQELAASEEPEETEDGDEEPDENEPMTLAAGDPIYLNGADGDDSNDGASADTAVKTFDKAKELAISNSTSTIYICGTVTYSSGDNTIDGSVDDGDNLTLYRYQEDTSDVLILVEGGTLTLKDITIDDQQIAETEPMVKVDGEDAVLNITDGTVIQNADDRNTQGTVADHSAVCVRNGTLNMSGGLITNNTGRNDGAGVSLKAAADSNNVAVMNMSGGTISNNSAAYGGGIDLYGNSTLNMTGGTVTENTATYNGGGIMVEQYATAIISGGYITYNKQTYDVGWGGGGIYVAENRANPASAGKLYIYNVEIAYNKAYGDPHSFTEYQAAVACCDTGELSVNLTDGEVFHDNYDTNTITMYRADGSAVFLLSPVMLGGYPYHWTDENGDELSLNELIDNHTGYFRARTAVSVDDGTVSGLDRCTTHICYNEAIGLGSAIASNGNVQIGHDDGDVSIAIEKNWMDADQMEGVTLPDEVNVVVYSVDSEGNKTFVGYETLTAEEGWKKTIEDLPKYDSDGSEFEYIVEESEESIHGWFSMVTGGKTESSGDDYYSDEDKTAKYEFTVTNTPIELLNLEKTVEGTTSIAEFEFKVTLYEPGDTDEDGNLNYYPYKGDVSVAYTVDGETTVDTLTFDEGVAYVTIPANGSASLEIGDGMQWWIEEVTTGADSTSYTVDDGESEEGTTAEGMIGTSNETVTFTNFYEEREPKLSKEIAEDDYERKEESGNMHDGEDTSGDGWGSWDDADNNQEIMYHLTLTDIKGATNVTVHDYLEDGLDFVQFNDAEEVDVVLYDYDEDGNLTERQLVEGEDFTWSDSGCTDPNGCAMDGCTFEVKFADEDFVGISDDAYIVITYKARTDSHEQDYDDYEDDLLNYAYLTYGPNSYRTQIITTETDLFGFGVYKYAVDDEEEVPLADAEFVLERDGKYAVFETETDEDTEDTYYMVSGWTDDKESAGILASGSDGMIRIEGLDDDDYTLTETAAPSGYEIVDETITVDIDEDGNVTVDGDTGSKEAVIGHVVNVENKEIPDENKPDENKPVENKPDEGNPDTGTPDATGGSGAPKTGDTNNLGGWLALMLACAVIVGDVLYIRRRRNYRN